jgi:hypothetical protein
MKSTRSSSASAARRLRHPAEPEAGPGARRHPVLTRPQSVLGCATVARMPSLSHEALLLLFRNRPELVPELLRDALHVELPAFTEVRVESADLTEVVPAEYRADLVVLLVDGKPVFAIAVEVQLQRSERKRFTWPVYVAGLRARFECEAAVLVVTPTEELARWASEPIRLGPSGTLTPLVIGPGSVPVVTDKVKAQAEPELAVLSVLAHGRGPVERAVAVAVAAAAGLTRVEDPELFVLYSDLIDSAISEAARKAFQMLPEGYQFQSEAIRKSLEKGKAEGKASDVLAILEARGLPVLEAQRQRVLHTTDLDTLDRWIRRAVTISSVDELFD